MKVAGTTHCRHGHPYDEANTYWWQGQRHCRACARGWKRRYKRTVAAKREEAGRFATGLRAEALSETQRAYLAGLIDGEGCISASMRPAHGRSGPNCRVGLSIRMATEEPLRTIADWLQIADPRLEPSRNVNRRAIYVVVLYGTVMAAVLAACRPYLILKADQADIALAMERLRAEAGGGWHGPRRLPLVLVESLGREAARLRVLNRRGAAVVEEVAS